MKKKISILLVFATLFIGTAYAQEDQSHKVNDVPVQVDGDLFIAETPNYLHEGVTYVPVIEFGKTLGLNVEENEVTHTATLSNDNKTMVFYPNINAIKEDDHLTITENYSFLKDDVLYVPLKDVCLGFELPFTWDHDARTVVVWVNESEDADQGLNPEYTEEDVLWLARIIQVESGNASDELETAVGNVVLNRVKSSAYPNTVYDVIMQVDSGYVQFPPAHKSSFSQFTPNESSIEAAYRVLNGENNVENCLYFNLVPFPGKGDDLYDVIDGEYFYL